MTLRRRSVHHAAFARCLRSSNVRSRVTPVENSVDRLVLVSVSRLDDLLELSRLAIERLPDPDPLTFALRAAVAQVRTEAILEP